MTEYTKKKAAGVSGARKKTLWEKIKNGAKIVYRAVDTFDKVMRLVKTVLAVGSLAAGAAGCTVVEHRGGRDYYPPRQGHRYPMPQGHRYPPRGRPHAQEDAPKRESEKGTVCAVRYVMTHDSFAPGRVKETVNERT